MYSSVKELFALWKEISRKLTTTSCLKLLNAKSEHNICHWRTRSWHGTLQTQIVWYKYHIKFQYYTAIFGGGGKNRVIIIFFKSWKIMVLTKNCISMDLFAKFLGQGLSLILDVVLFWLLYEKDLHSVFCTAVGFV